MAITQFSSLADIVLLEIFGYLSCEDALYAFADLADMRLVALLRERGAYSQICLSSQLPLLQYSGLSQGIWRYELIRSFVCKDMFSDFVPRFTPCRLFSSLIELRLLFVRRPLGIIAKFVIAHASTLTHFTFTTSDQSYCIERCENFLHYVLPHLNQLIVLDIDEHSGVQVEYIRDFQLCRLLFVFRLSGIS
jgi:hypothetical protein